MSETVAKKFWSAHAGIVHTALTLIEGEAQKGKGPAEVFNRTLAASGRLAAHGVAVTLMREPTGHEGRIRLQAELHTREGQRPQALRMTWEPGQEACQVGVRDSGGDSPPPTWLDPTAGKDRPLWPPGGWPPSDSPPPDVDRVLRVVRHSTERLNAQRPSREALIETRSSQVTMQTALQVARSLNHIRDWSERNAASGTEQETHGAQGHGVPELARRLGQDGTGQLQLTYHGDGTLNQVVLHCRWSGGYRLQSMPHPDTFMSGERPATAEVGGNVYELGGRVEVTTSPMGRSTLAVLEEINEGWTDERVGELMATVARHPDAATRSSMSTAVNGGAWIDLRPAEQPR